MAGTAVAGRIDCSLQRGGYEFRVANAADDADLRRLLRNNPTPGRFAFSMEREPCAFDATGLALRQVFVIARDLKTGEAVGACERVVRESYVNGKCLRLPYLGALRVVPEHRHRIGILRGGFEALRRFAERPDEAPFALTSIGADNDAALRLLTRGLPGLPVYREVGSHSTFVLRASRRPLSPAFRLATTSDIPLLVRFLNHHASAQQFAAHWREEHLATLAGRGLPLARIAVMVDAAGIAATLAVWDQTAFRQTVVRRYPEFIRWARPAINALVPLFGVPAFPAVGEPLRFGVMSLLAMRCPEAAAGMIAAAQTLAQQAGLDGVIAAGPSGSAFAKAARRATPVEYRTRLFAVHWPEGCRAAEAVSGRAAWPELGFL